MSRARVLRLAFFWGVIAAVVEVGDGGFALAARTRGGRAAKAVEDVREPPPVAPSTNLALAALDRRIADLELQEEKSKRELTAVGSRLVETHARVLSRGRAYYRLTRAGMLPVGGGFGEFVAHALRVERAHRTLGSELELEEGLRQRGAALSQELERIARDRSALASQRSAMSVAQLAADDEVRRQTAFDRAFATSTGSTDYVAVNGGRVAAPSAFGGSFASAKGRLLFPLPGRAEVRPAQREGTSGPGLEIRTTESAPVRAVFGGRVAFADRYGPYGRLVIVDHGDHYFTVSGNLAEIHVKVGDEVTAGERLGTAGDEGRGSMLYFEIRHATQTIAPGPWLGF